MNIQIFRINTELQGVQETDNLHEKDFRKFIQSVLGENQFPQDLFVISDHASFCMHCMNNQIPVAALLSEEMNQDLSFVPYAVTSIEDLDYEYLEKVWQRCKDIPWTICETDRCVIRETTEEDVEFFYRIYEEPSITEYMENLFDDPEDERQYARDYKKNVYSFYGFGMWTICLKETGEVIGRAGLSMREEFDEPELGYMIAVPFQKRGLAEEVCRAILEYGREELGFEQVQILTEPENEASFKLAEKLGFEEAGEINLKGKTYERLLKRLDKV